MKANSHTLVTAGILGLVLYLLLALKPVSVANIKNEKIQEFINPVTCSAGDLGVSAITATGAEFNYTAQCKQVIEHGVCFSEKPNPVRGSSKKAAFYKGFPIDIPVKTTFKVTTDILVPETQYFARAYVKNLDGDILYSSEINFITSVAPDSLQYPKLKNMDGVNKEYYKNGKLAQMYVMKNGQLDGLFKMYSDSGWLVSEQYFRKGEMNGSFKTYFKSGHLRSESNFSNNKLSGPSAEYYENGNPKMESNCSGEPDNLSGQIKLYYENGNLNKEITVSNGTLMKSLTYDQENRLTYDESPGRSVHYWWDRDGNQHVSINGVEQKQE